MADDLEADDAAQQAEINMKRALDEANYALAASTLAQEAAVLDLSEATEAKDEADLVLEAMSTAKDEALLHL